MASEYEGFPMTACEAAAMGKTIITTPVEGIIDYMEKGKTGYYYDFENAEGLANILKLMERGRLSICDPIECRSSVERYETGRYFSGVMDILERFCHA